MRGRPTGRELPIRRGSVQVRRQPIRRSSPRFRPVQMYALLAMVLCVLMTVALSATPVLAGRRLVVQGARFTGEELVRQLAGMTGSPNLFGLQTDRIAERLVGLPAIESAKVEVRLPDTVLITVVEREPRIVWVVGGVRYVASETGLLFGMVDEAGNPVPPSSLDLLPGPAVKRPPSPSPSAGDSASAPARSGVTARPSSRPSAPARTATPRPSPKSAASATPAGEPSAGGSHVPRPSLLPVPTPDPSASAGPAAVSLPVVYDRREADASLGLGDFVDPIVLDAGFRIASLSPSDVGSTAALMSVAVDDLHGFTLAAPSRGWVAEFGFYTQTLRKVGVIPEQVRGLRSLLLWAGEDKVAWVWLMADISDSHIIDYLPK